MAKFVPKRFEQILTDMIARVVTRSGLSDISDTSVIKHALAAAARGDDEIYYQMTLILQLFSIDTATGDDLDERAKDIQPAVVPRILAQKSTGQVVFTRAGTAGTVSISTGTKVKTSGGITFTTTTTGTISPASPEQILGNGVGRDSNLVSAVADIPGAEGNVASNTIIKFGSKPAGVDEVTNPSLFANGRDQETDDSFRNRLKLYISSLSRSTVSAVEANLIGQQDPTTFASILFAKVVEDLIDRGEVTIYVDDGTGSAESTTTPDVVIVADLTWNGTTTVTTGDTSELAVGEWVKLNSDGQLFEITSIVPSTSFDILNPGADAIASGSGASASSKSDDLITDGLSGPPADSAVGGEEFLSLGNKPIKSPSLPVVIASSTRGNLVENTDFIVNPPDGRLKFTPALVTGEVLAASYLHYTGLIAFAQKIVDGDVDDRVEFPGLRAAGTRHTVLVPQILLQNVVGVLTVSDGFDQTTVLVNVTEAIKEYINTLNISDDVIRNEIINRIMLVDGVFDVILSTPAVNVAILDDQLARTQDANVTIT